MRTIRQIKEDIDDHHRKIYELEKEVEDFQRKCPHPEPFVTMSLKDVEDDCGGPGIYEYTIVTYSCSLCEGNFFGRYNKVNKYEFRDNPPPTLKEIIERQE